MTHILIVDSDPILVFALREELELCGCTVSSVADGAEVLEQADAHIPDLILLEIATPDGDALQHCRALRSHPRLHSVPIIFMSACSELADKLAAYEAGADDYVTKPFALPELCARLRAVLRRSAAHDAAEGGLPLPQEADLHMLTVISQAAEAAKTNGSVLETAGLRLHLDKALVECGSRKAHLTPMECEVLHFLWMRLDTIVSSRRMLRELWLYPEGVGDPTAVRWHVKNLRRKIELDPTHPVRLRTFAHHGYMLVSDVTAV